MDLVATKILIAFLFGVIRFLFGILPIKICAWFQIKSVEEIKLIINEKRRFYIEFATSIVQSFGGGVLFATSFLHMMPEVYMEVEELREYGMLSADYPYSQLIISLGFFTVYFAEEISHWLISRTPQEPYKKGSKKPVFVLKSGSNQINPEIKQIENGKAFVIQQHNYFINENEKSEIEFQNSLNTAEFIVDSVDQGVQTETDDDTKKSMDDEELETAELVEIIEEEVKTQQQILRCILMVMALSLHAMFEGLAIGLQQSISNIWYLFTAASVHSATILFSVGMEVVLAGTTTKSTMIHMSMLSGTSSLGVIIGLVITLTTDLHTSAKSSAIILLEGLSAGTILYITFFEILAREKHRRTWRTARAICIGSGFALMALLQCLKVGT